jgi:ESX secretion-associated protein EspG
MTFTLSLVAADVLGQALDVDVRQFPFDIPSFGEYERDRQRLARQVFTDLHRRGLVRNGDLDPDLTRAMRLLSDHAITVAVMGTVESTREIYARAATNGESAVLAVKDGERFTLELIRPTALALTLVGLLPRADAGPGQSVTITQPEPKRRDDEYLTPLNVNRGANDQQLRIAASYLNRPRTGTGFFTVSGRDKWSNRETKGGGLTWLDTDVGRYLTVTRPPGDDGQVRSTFSPADTARMTRQLGELIESVAPRR